MFHSDPYQSQAPPFGSQYQPLSSYEFPPAYGAGWQTGTDRELRVAENSRRRSAISLPANAVSLGAGAVGVAGFGLYVLCTTVSAENEGSVLAYSGLGYGATKISLWVVLLFGAIFSCLATCVGCLGLFSTVKEKMEADVKATKPWTPNDPEIPRHLTAVGRTLVGVCAAASCVACLLILIASIGYASLAHTKGYVVRSSNEICVQPSVTLTTFNCPTTPPGATTSSSTSEGSSGRRLPSWYEGHDRRLSADAYLGPASVIYLNSLDADAKCTAINAICKTDPYEADFDISTQNATASEGCWCAGIALALPSTTSAAPTQPSGTMGVTSVFQGQFEFLAAGVTDAEVQVGAQAALSQLLDTAVGSVKANVSSNVAPTTAATPAPTPTPAPSPAATPAPSPPPATETIEDNSTNNTTDESEVPTPAPGGRRLVDLSVLERWTVEWETVATVSQQADVRQITHGFNTSSTDRERLQTQLKDSLVAAGGNASLLGSLKLEWFEEPQEITTTTTTTLYPTTQGSGQSNGETGESGQNQPTAVPTMAPTAPVVDTLDWETVDGGANRACRGPDGANLESYYNRAPNSGTYEECKKQCDETVGCYGVEYKGFPPRHCELWMVEIATSAAKTGYTCVRKTYNAPELKNLQGAWEEVDDAINRQCKGPTGESPEQQYKTVEATSRQDCMKQCMEASYCTGMDYSMTVTGRACHIWHEPIEGSEYGRGHTCLKKLYAGVTDRYYLPVDAGTDRACRGPGGSNDPKYFSVYTNATDLEDCEQLCANTFDDEDTTNDCEGIEHSPNRCEVWTYEIETTAPNPGHECLEMSLAPAIENSSSNWIPVNGGVNLACRGIGEENSKHFFRIHESADTFDECKTACAKDTECTGFEFRSTLPKKCEIWIDPIDTAEKKAGYSCVKKATLETTGDWSPIDGGIDRGCTGQGNAVTPDMFKLTSGVQSPDDCKALCTGKHCRGIDYGEDGSCRVWIKYVHGGTYEDGHICLRFGAAPPTAAPTAAPTQAPTHGPTRGPTAAPTNAPTEAPTPAFPPGIEPPPATAVPTGTPTVIPTVIPTAIPTAAVPTPAPTELEFAVAPQEALLCPKSAGAYPVGSAGLCKIAADSLGKVYGGEMSLAKHLPDCIEMADASAQPNGTLIFNSGGGTSATSGFAVCEKQEITTTAPSRLLSSDVEDDEDFVDSPDDELDEPGFLQLSGRHLLAETAPTASQRGAFCWDWYGSDVDWCFVNEDSHCETSDCEQVGNTAVCKSSVACGYYAATRSTYVIEGENAIRHQLTLFLILALSLFLEGICALCLFNRPSPPPTVEEMDVMGLPTPDSDLEMRFLQAQEHVTMRLNDDTPEDVRLMVYGLYQQAKEGNVRGARPDYDPMEIAKWDYWAQHRNMTRHQAIQGYLRLAATI
eukprot:TRINITY_DN7431_c0_g1_i1.p1 TRINITY_DN7431_c0_g1~~TRINITY_DN7431_c0_g1_i1.p1  ORF type:complete len:1404 (-),score=259.29 TRINITY_DN7431_c0_g1_i1:208-4419(-)